MAKTEIFPLCTRDPCTTLRVKNSLERDSCTTLWVKNLLEITISYGFRDIDTFSFSKKIQYGRQKWQKLKFSPFPQDTLVPPCGSKIHSKSLYLLRFSRYCHFFIFHKNPRWPPKVAKIEISPLWTRDSCTTLWVKNSLKIALSLTVFEVLTLFHFLRKSKMTAKSGKN